MSKPRIVISRCLGYEACRYNGEMIDVSWRDKLEELANVITFCPEVAAGLGVPRKPINLFKVEGEVHVVQEGTELIFTDALEKASDDFLSNAGEVDGFILKSKSPSCGLGTTKIVFGDSHYFSSGVFARKATEKYLDSSFTDESTIENKGVTAFLLSI